MPIFIGAIHIRRYPRNSPTAAANMVSFETAFSTLSLILAFARAGAVYDLLQSRSALIQRNVTELIEHPLRGRFSFASR